MTDRMPTPVEVAVARTRAAVLRADERALSSLADAFAGAIDLLVADAERAARAILADVAAGTVSPSAAGTLQRTTALIRRVEADLARLVPAASRAIFSAQVEAGLVAIQHAATLTTVAVGGGVSPGLRVALVPRAAVIDLIGALDYQTPLGRALATLGQVAAEAVRTEMTAGLVAGHAPRVVAASIRTRLASLLGGVGGDGVPRLGWLQQVARTSMLGAYRSSLIATYAANPRLVSGWRWSAALQGRTCPSCLAKSGQVYPLTTPFRSHRACRCSAVPALVRPVGRPPETGEAWLRRQGSDTQAAVLGQTGAERWRAGDFALTDLLEDMDDPLFGPYVGHGSIDRAVARADRRRRVAA